MRIMVGGLPQRRRTFHDTLRASEIGIEHNEIELLAPIEVTAEVTRMGLDVYVDCTVTTAVKLSCSRCLEEFRRDIRIRSQMLFIPAEHGHKGPHARTAEGGVFLYREFIDLTDRIAEAIREGLPMKPLCRPDCRGLCPRCGQNLNEGECQCPTADEEYHPFKDLKL